MGKRNLRNINFRETRSERVATQQYGMFAKHWKKLTQVVKFGFKNNKKYES